MRPPPWAETLDVSRATGGRGGNGDGTWTPRVPTPRRHGGFARRRCGAPARHCGGELAPAARRQPVSQAEPLAYEIDLLPLGARAGHRTPRAAADLEDHRGDRPATRLPQHVLRGHRPAPATPVGR